MKKAKNILTIIVLIITLISALTIPFAIQFHKDTITNVTVTDKAVKRYDNTDKYLIYTDKGTFEITDSIVIMRFNSSDVYGNIQNGQTYNFVVRGYRFPIFSMYQNIESIELISK